MTNIFEVLNNDHIHEIVPNLYLGNMFSTHPNILYKYGIDCVLNLGGHETDLNKNKYKLYAQSIITIDDIPQNAKRMLDEVIPYGVKFIDNCMKDRKRVLVHCAAGVSRSSTVVIAWLMKTYSMDRDKAHLMVKQARKIIRPNDGFMQALSEYQKHLTRSSMLRGVLRGSTAGGGRSYNYTNTSNTSNTKKTNNNQQIQQLPVPQNIIKSTPDISYYREYEEKMNRNDDFYKY